MAKDANGMDIDNVFIPLTQGIDFQAADGTLPDEAELLAASSTPLEGLSGVWYKGGLQKAGGGNTWTIETDGEEVLFEQDGYSIKSGGSTATLEVIFAEYGEAVMALRGQTMNGNGYSTVDAAGSSAVWKVRSVEMSTNYAVRQRVFEATASVSEEQVTRGEVQGYPVTFTLRRQIGAGTTYHYAELLSRPSEPIES